MPTNINVDGNGFSIDNQGELGANQQTRMISLLQALAQRLFYLSPTVFAAVSGILRLAKTDAEAWRNNANNADLLLQIGNPTNNAAVANDALSFKGQMLSDGPGLNALQTTVQSGITTVTTVKFDNVITDSDSAYNTGTGLFTVPAGKGGWYSIDATVRLNQAAAPGVQALQITAGSQTVQNLSNAAIAAGTGNTMTLSMKVFLAGGNTIFVQVSTTAGTAGTAASAFCNLSIKRIA